MSKSDVFYSLTAVFFLGFIAYCSIHTEIIEKISTITQWEEVPVYETDTLTVTQVDTVWKYKTYRDDIVMNGGDLIMQKDYLFHLAEDIELSNSIRDKLPFGDVFNWWREKLGPCGLFEWNDRMYITLYEEEHLEECLEWAD